MTTQVYLPSSIPQSKSGIKPRRKGLAVLRSHRTLRRVVQFGFAAFIAFIAIRHVLVGEAGATITASWEAYCPLGGLESLYRYVTSGGKFVSHIHLSNLVVLVAALATALLARNAFCGWVCPLGFIQDLTSGLSRFLQRRVPFVKNAIRSIKRRGARLSVIDRPLRLVKYAVLAWAVTGTAVYGFLVFRDYDPWAALFGLLELSIGPGLLVLGLTFVASFFVERPWCRYACPLGAATGLVSKLSPVYLKREGDACKSCAVCSRACPMGLPVHTADKIKSAECIGCLECVDKCPREGALELKLGY